MNADDCKQAPGRFGPVIDRNRCEGKSACVQVCPTGVLAVETLPVPMREGLSLRGRLKGWAHRWQQALVVRADACQACGRCVTSCPEHAITLALRAPRN